MPCCRRPDQSAAARGVVEDPQKALRMVGADRGEMEAAAERRAAEAREITDRAFREGQQRAVCAALESPIGPECAGVFPPSRNLASEAPF